MFFFVCVCVCVCVCVGFCVFFALIFLFVLSGHSKYGHRNSNCTAFQGELPRADHQVPAAEPGLVRQERPALCRHGSRYRYAKSGDGVPRGRCWLDLIFRACSTCHKAMPLILLCNLALQLWGWRNPEICPLRLCTHPCSPLQSNTL